VCDCITLTQEALAPRNTELVLVLSLTGKRPTTVSIQTQLIEKKRGARALAVIPTYCPFCGEKYPEPSA
jgi:hypothetical protein